MKLYKLSYNGVVVGARLCEIPSCKYSLDMDLEVDKLILRYYNENNPEVEANVMGNHVYCTLTGKLAFSIADLREKLKKDIVGIIIARTHLKLLHYNE